MPHKFHSGVFVESAAWHGLGTVIPEATNTEAMFRQAGALYEVVPRPLFLGGPDGVPSSIPLTGHRAIVHSESGKLMSVQTDKYECIQNTQLLEVANALREDTSLEAVVVLDEGRKATFTAKINAIEGAVTPNDLIQLKLVACTSHDGSQAFTLMWVPFRVECANLLAMALSVGDRTGRIMRIPHFGNPNATIARLPEIIDLAGRSFTTTIEELQAMAATPCNTLLFQKYLEAVYADELRVPINDTRGDASTRRQRRVSDLPGYNIIHDAWQGDMRGADLPGVQGTLYGAYNAITHFVRYDALKNKDGEDNPDRQARRYGSLLVGRNSGIIQKARAAALELTRA
jgi:phage/plasmid-like protein (TIGR03299 family)